MVRKSRGQSVLEYVIILTVIIAAILLFARGVLTTNLQNSLNNAAVQMENAAKKINF